MTLLLAGSAGWHEVVTSRGHAVAGPLTGAASCRAGFLTQEPTAYMSSIHERVFMNKNRRPFTDVSGAKPRVSTSKSEL